MKSVNIFAAVLVFAVMVLAPDNAMAGVGGAALNTVWIQIVDLAQGTLGRIITLLIVVGGTAAAVRTQQLWPFVVGLSAGIGLYASPTVISSLVAGLI